ncbi:MAG: PQQ-binding-like beta-propeller repeat protein [Candidatus Hydrogenedentes bacterium]|nr:PQQ-binding-like beta-propeller repeat protein [Candidatus Hydrogenedentota bacterium]
MHSLVRSFVFAAGAVIATCAVAGESPQFRGPNRDGVFADETGLLKSWPEGGPKKLWVAAGIGRGYSSVSVAGGKIYVTGMRDDETGVLSIFDLSGKLERTIPYGKETMEKQAPGARSTPTLDGERVYFLSGIGVLYCIDLTAGKAIWDVNILERFGGALPMWHIAESVLIDGNNVICTPGGKEGRLAALNKMTGDTVWTTTGFEDTASYCSPAIFTHNGRRILTTATAATIVGAEPDTGKLLWAFAHKGPYDIHAVTPIYKDGGLYYVAGDGFGGGMLRLSEDGASVTPTWENKSLDCVHSGVVLVDGHLYGTGYRADAALECLEFDTGAVKWSAPEIQEGIVVYADGMLYVYEGPKKGLVSLVKAQPSGFERTGSFEITDGGDDKHWAHPTVANGVLYIRHGDAVIAYELKG